MATLIRTNGFQEEVHPANGKSFTLREVQTLIGGYIEIVHTKDGKLLVVDEEGKLKNKPINHVATTFYRYAFHDTIVGEALIGTPEELGEGEDDED